MVKTPNYDLDVDTSLGGADASDYVIPSQKAIKSYVDNNTGSTVDQTFDGTSANAQSGVAIEGELSTNYVKSSAENTSLGITSSIGYVGGFAPFLQLNFGTYNFSVSCSEGAALQAIDTSTGDDFILSVIPNGLTMLQNSSQQALLTLSSNSNLVINGNEVATVNDIPTVNNSTITFTQGGVTKGSITLNQANNDTIALDAGGGGGASALTDLSDVSITSASSGEALTYDGSDWINAPKTLVTIKDWTVS